jgi:hypothetical protein
MRNTCNISVFSYLVRRYRFSYLVVNGRMTSEYGVASPYGNTPRRILKVFQNLPLPSSVLMNWVWGVGNSLLYATRISLCRRVRPWPNRETTELLLSFVGCWRAETLETQDCCCLGLHFYTHDVWNNNLLCNLGTNCLAAWPESWTHFWDRLQPRPPETVLQMPQILLRQVMWLA